MKVLVTGSEGFLGWHVCVALTARGYDVVRLDSAPTAEVVADITKVLPLMQVDAVIHLAAVAAPLVCDKNPELAFSVNVLGTQQVLRLALESGAKKFVFSSSAHVYGVGPKYLPTDEYHPLFLQNTYTTTKILGEQLCQLYHDNHGLSYTALRLFNAYGPGQMRGYFIPDQLAKTEMDEIILMGGETTKDWVYVDDVARAFCLALETAYVGVMNIGTGVQTPLSEVARLIALETGATLRLMPSNNATRMQADYALAQRVLGWKPTVDLKEGLRAVCREVQARSVHA